MLGLVSRFGSSKGMVAVPDLSGKTVTEAQALLSQSGLLSGTTTSTVRNDTQSLDGKTYTQSISAGVIVDYETVIDFSYWTYVYVPPAQPPETYTAVGYCGEYRTDSNTYSGCNGSLYYSYLRETYYQLYQGNYGSSYYSYCGQQDYGDKVGTLTAGQCGQPSFTPYCDPYGAYGPCKPGGTKTKTQTCYSYLGDPGWTHTYTASCTCTASTTYSSWGTCKNKQQWRNVYWTNSDCTSGSYSQVRAC